MFFVAFCSYRFLLYGTHSLFTKFSIFYFPIPDHHDGVSEKFIQAAFDKLRLNGTAWIIHQHFFVTLFVTLKTFKTLDKRENCSLNNFEGSHGQDLCEINITICYSSRFCTFLLNHTTFELNIKCLCQHPATSNHLEITSIEWREVFDPLQ